METGNKLLIFGLSDFEIFLVLPKSKSQNPTLTKSAIF